MTVCIPYGVADPVCLWPIGFWMKVGTPSMSGNWESSLPTSLGPLSRMVPLSKTSEILCFFLNTPKQKEMHQNQENQSVVGSTYRQTLIIEMLVLYQSDTCFHCLDFLLQPPWEFHQRSWTFENAQSVHHCPLGLLQTEGRVYVH